MPSRTPIGGLLLHSVEGWAFSVRGGIVAGKRREEPGVFRITSVAPNQLPQPLSHEHCLRLGEKFVGAAEGKISDRHMMHSVTGPFGSASFRRGKDKICVWYCNRPAGLIIGAYACPAELSKTAQYNFTRAQCARIIATAVFDRPSWGGEDDLTRILVAQLAEEERQDQERPVPTPRETPTRPPASSSRGQGKRRRT